ncbi:MAG: hypothetical protein AB8B95_04670 [Pseudohongiellaceae bacterium]
MSSKSARFHPFYDPHSHNGGLSNGIKALISLGLGAVYGAAQFVTMPNRAAFYSENCLILAAIITTAVMALYLATDVFRESLDTVDKFYGSDEITSQIVDHWLSDKQFYLAGSAGAVANMAVAHVLGIPGEFHIAYSSLVVMYSGYLISGFAAGMGLLAIIAVIALYLKLAPSLEQALDPKDPDGNGGIKRLGDALWFFATLIAALAVLICIYMFGVSWQSIHQPAVRIVFIFWISLPFLVAMSIVLIPGLAVRRHVGHYKIRHESQLKQEKAELYSSFKQFKNVDDEDIISSKKELSEKLTEISVQMEQLRKMRKSHIDGREDT